MTTRKPIGIVFDIETTDFKADFGELTHFGWQDIYADEEAKVKACYEYKSWKKDKLNDRELVEFARDKLDSADLIIGHYSKKFDLPFLQTRCLYHGIDPVYPKIKHIDTWHIARYSAKFGSNSMANILDFFEIGEKHHLPKSVWRRGKMGDVDALKLIGERCVADVSATVDMFYTLSKIAPPSFNLNIITGNTEVACTQCGSENYTKKGYAYTQVSCFQRYICNDCGKQFQGRENLAIRDKRVATK